MIQANSNIVARTIPSNNRLNSSQDCAKLSKEQSFNELNESVTKVMDKCTPYRQAHIIRHTFHTAVQYIKDNSAFMCSSSCGFSSLPDNIGDHAELDIGFFNLIMAQKDNIMNLYVVNKPTSSFAEEKVDIDNEHVQFGQLLSDSIDEQCYLIALNDWVNNAPEGEENTRHEARKRIIICIKNMEPSLNLQYLNMRLS